MQIKLKASFKNCLASNELCGREIDSLMKQEHIDMKIQVDNIRKGEKKGKENNEFNPHVKYSITEITVWNTEK